MLIYFDFDLGYLHFRLELRDLWSGFYIKNKKPSTYTSLILNFYLAITNNDFHVSNYKEFSFCFDNDCGVLTISTWDNFYDFDIPACLFRTKTEKYVDHFNWVKEAYVS
jgi:hypothetical protein